MTKYKHLYFVAITKINTQSQSYVRVNYFNRDLFIYAHDNKYQYLHEFYEFDEIITYINHIIKNQKFINDINSTVFDQFYKHFTLINLGYEISFIHKIKNTQCKIYLTDKIEWQLDCINPTHNGIDNTICEKLNNMIEYILQMFK